MSSLDICSVECITLLHCTETRILQGRKREREERGEGEGKGESRQKKGRTRKEKEDKEKGNSESREGKGRKRKEKREKEEIGTKLVAAHLSDGPGSLGVHGGVGPSCVRKLSWQLLCEV